MSLVNRTVDRFCDIKSFLGLAHTEWFQFRLRSFELSQGLSKVYLRLRAIQSVGMRGILESQHVFVPLSLDVHSLTKLNRREMLRETWD